MESRDICVEGIRSLVKIVEQVRDDQWDMTMPDDFPTMTEGAKPTLRSVVNSLAYDIAWIPDVLSGKTMAETGDEKFKGDLLGDDPVKSFTTIADTSLAAIAAYPDFDRTVHVSYMTYPARNYLTDISGYYGLSAFDISKALGIHNVVSPALTEGLWHLLSPVAEEWRAMGIFGPAVAVPDDANLETKLLGLTGRMP